MNKSEKTAITSLTGIIMIVILAIATSCSSNKLLSKAQHYENCPAYH